MLISNGYCLHYYTNTLKGTITFIFSLMSAGIINLL